MPLRVYFLVIWHTLVVYRRVRRLHPRPFGDRPQWFVEAMGMPGKKSEAPVVVLMNALASLELLLRIAKVD